MSSILIIESRKIKMTYDFTRTFQYVFFRDLTQMLEGIGYYSLESIFSWVDLTEKDFFGDTELETLFNQEKDIWLYHYDAMNRDEDKRRLTEIQFTKKTNLCNWISELKSLRHLLKSKIFCKIWSIKNQKSFMTTSILMKIRDYTWRVETSIYHDNPTLEFINESEFEYANRNQEDDLTSPAIDATSFSDKLKNIYTNKSEHIILEDLELILNESKGKAIIKKGNPIEFFKEDIQKIEKICQTNIDECLIAAFIY